MKRELDKALHEYRIVEEQYPFYVRSMYIMILHIMIKIVPCNMSDLEKMTEYILKTEQSHKIENLLLTYAEIVENEFENEAKASNRVIYQIKQYINLHYHEDLKLSHLAEQVYLSTNYLSNIYNLLKAGKPVAIGAKTSSGGQHWVVVTGYKGGNTLKASNFTINDPGSSTRDTLDDLFSSYPIFYKIAYYK